MDGPRVLAIFFRSLAFSRSIRGQLLHPSETNLTEKEESELALQAGEVVLPTRPYEVKSVKVQFSRSVK